MPLSFKIKHSHIIKLVNSLGYEAEDDGMCNGITMMGIQAFTVGDVKVFNERLQFLRKHNITKRFAKFQRKVKKTTPSNRMSRLIQRNQKIIDVVAFCDGVNLYQDPGNGEEVFGSYLNQQDHEIIARYVNSSKLDAIGGLRKINSWVGVYDDKELKKYVRELDKIARKIKCSFSLLLNSSDHTMAMCYDAKIEKWFVIDANALPISQRILKKIPRWIQAGFDKPTKTVAFVSSIIIAGEHKEYIHQFERAVNESKVMAELHRVTEDKAKFADYNDSTLAHLAARSGFAEVIEALQLVGANLNALDNVARTPANYAALFGHVDAIKSLHWAGANLTWSDKFGRTPAYNAMIYGYLDVLRFLSRVGIDLSAETPRGYLLANAKEQNVTASVAFLENYMRWKAREGVGNLFTSINRSGATFFKPADSSTKKRNVEQIGCNKRLRMSSGAN